MFLKKIAMFAGTSTRKRTKGKESLFYWLFRSYKRLKKLGISAFQFLQKLPIFAKQSQ